MIDTHRVSNHCLEIFSCQGTLSASSRRGLLSVTELNHIVAVLSSYLYIYYNIKSRKCIQHLKNYFLTASGGDVVRIGGFYEATV